MTNKRQEEFERKLEEDIDAIRAKPTALGTKYTFKQTDDPPDSKSSAGATAKPSQVSHEADHNLFRLTVTSTDNGANQEQVQQRRNKADPRALFEISPMSRSNWQAQSTEDK